MKTRFGFAGKLALLLVVMVFGASLFLLNVAGIAGDNGTLNRLIMSTELRLKSAARMQLYGSSYIDFGDSATVRAGAALAKIDSFFTTGASDTVKMLGARLGDVFIVTPYVPAHSSTPDTGALQYGARFLNTDSVLVVRTLKNATGSTLKSGAQYALMVLSKQ